MEAYEALKLEANPKVAPFQPGDTVKVSVRIREGDRERLQAFQGIVTKQRGIGPAKAFTVRRVTSGIGVERTFLIYSPNVESVDVIRRGKVKRAKLFYLRGLSSKESRIKERTAPAKAPKAAK